MTRDDFKKEVLLDFTRKHNIAHLEYDLSKEIDRILECVDEEAYDEGYTSGFSDGEDAAYAEGYEQGYDDCQDGDPRDLNPSRY